jgi:hypothetical protein
VLSFSALSLSALFLCSFSALSLCHPRSGPDEAIDEVGELVVEGGAMGLELGSECSDQSHPKSGPDEAVDDELMIEGGAVRLELGRA